MNASGTSSTSLNSVAENNLDAGNDQPQAIPAARLSLACETVRAELWAQQSSAGFWPGELASSALSTATAISALSIYCQHAEISDSERESLDLMIVQGLDYLAAQQNFDGGWGDTDKSYSNISTSTLAVAAFHLATSESANRLREFDQVQLKASRYLDEFGGAEKIRARYGKDKTFAVPILANAALAGLVDWQEVGVLPFEAAVVPQRFYHLMQLPVVSYAIPALVAIGQAKFLKDPPGNFLLRQIRQRSINRSLKVLERMQPASGGYLEAIPLTSFVVMSLAATERANHSVVKNGIRFLQETFRDDGSWPIDSNLATWNTTLAVNALASAGEKVDSQECLDWLLSCQHTERHPFTGAEPGGFGWSDLSGAVPDSDDTPGAILSLRHFLASSTLDQERQAQIQASIKSAENWLVKLQNRDGGWPTFCRGWGKLPFDRSGTDLTAHVLRALKDSKNVNSRVIERGFAFLDRNQRENGSWIPLWFGNQDNTAIAANSEENPVYGTAKVLLAYRDWKRFDTQAAQRGLKCLVDQQGLDGGWGGGASVGGQLDPTKQTGIRSSIEETGLAIEALADALQDDSISGNTLLADSIRRAVMRGTEFLINEIEDRSHLDPWPIGFYFAKLWYYERTYPLVFALAALGRVQSNLNQFTDSVDG